MTSTTRAPYTGPRTRFTLPDGTYGIDISLAWADLPTGDQETPALAHAALRVNAALGRQGFEGTKAHAGTLAHVEVVVEAESDEAAVEIFERLVADTGAVSARLAYRQPNEQGGYWGSDTQVALA